MKLSLHSIYSKTGQGENIRPGKVRSEVGEVYDGMPAKRVVLSPVSGVPVRFVCVWDDQGKLDRIEPMGGTKMSFSVAGGLVTVPGLSCDPGDQICWMDGAAPNGCTEGTIYYVVEPSGESFKVSATLNGSPISITAKASSQAKIAKVVGFVSYGAADDMEIEILPPQVV